MKSSRIPQAFVAAAVLALSSSGAFAAELHALSDSEMSAVYGQGLSDPALTVLGARSSADGGSALSVAALADAVAGVGALSSDVQSLDRQLAQQRLQGAATGMQVTLKITQTMAAADKALLPVVSGMGLGLLAFPLVGLPSLASLEAIQNKH
jgi:hypothetical protein